MAGTKSRSPTVKVVENWIRQGFGQGAGSTYKPLMYVRDVPSQSAGHMVHSLVTDRPHHYLADGPYMVHLLAEYEPSTIDIREQYALLPWEELQIVAKKVGLRYPAYGATGTPKVLTTDVLLTMRRSDGQELIAIAVVPKHDLENEGVIERLWLERFYWNSRGIRWIVVSTIPLRARNLLFFEGALRRRAYIDKLGTPTAQIADTFSRFWTEKKTYNDILFPTAEAHGLTVADTSLLLGAAVWRRQSSIDLDSRELRHYAPVPMHNR